MCHPADTGTAAAVDGVIARGESVRDRETIVRRALQSGGDIRAPFEEYGPPP